MPGHHIHISGRVQGVGFRPFVYDLAHGMNLPGWVSNGMNGVQIYLECTDPLADQFYERVIREAPSLSIISHHKMLSEYGFEAQLEEFTIRESNDADKMDMLLPPDFALCPQCRSELLDAENKRYRYPFITCTKCGPRYSILNSLPYDRERTAMEDFKMCPDCEKEYDDIHDRRYYSQTNSCASCQVSLTLWDGEQNKISTDQDEIIRLIRQSLFDDGKILAVKGIGGYLLMVDGTDREAIKELRRRKKRSSKPFALMYPSIDILSRDVVLRDCEREELESERSPIVLVQLKSTPESDVCADQAAPGMDSLGVMLPYTGLYELILEGKDRPIIATSGNISNSPIIFDDGKALDELGEVADLIVTNDREIFHPQDDSVVRFSDLHEQKIIIRRSRGMAPSFYSPHKEISEPQCLLATGADMKSTFSIFSNNKIFTSQYLGDLTHYDCEESYYLTLSHLKDLIQCVPATTLTDLHPEYVSTRLGRGLAQEMNTNIEMIQHHEAHFAAVLAENDLVHSEAKIMGVVWDGTGYGHDDHIWGGEFFSYDEGQIFRWNHLAYYPHIAGDKMSREPKLSLLSLLRDSGVNEELIRNKFTDREWYIYHGLANPHHGLLTSSIGRIFDAVASLLNLADINDYEGHAAILLESSAKDYLKKNNIPKGCDLSNVFDHDEGVDMRPVIRYLLDDLKKGREVGEISAKFHITLVDIIERLAERGHFQYIAFSGGVFQNALLVDLIISRLSENYRLFFHKELSPNDENISFGQIAHHSIRQHVKGQTSERNFVEVEIN